VNNHPRVKYNISLCLTLDYSFRSEEKEADCPLPNNIRDMMWNFHMELLRHCGEQIDQNEADDTEVVIWSVPASTVVDLIWRPSRKRLFVKLRPAME